jgi:hypothetical protein
VSELSAHIALAVHIEWLSTALHASFDAVSRLTETVDQLEREAAA